MQILKKTGLKALEKAKEIGPDSVISILKEKMLTGRGGAGFPTGMKWDMVRKAEGSEKYVICNADEGEPGTFKDKFIIENNPETLVEGILIACHCINAKKAYIYLRGEYDYLENKLKKTIKDVLKKAESDIDIEIFMGAGAYICGDETAIISSIEGLRGQPRAKPPYPTTNGLFGKPTIINNLETLTNVPIALYYDDWEEEIRLHSVSGNVTMPGVYELPMNSKLSDLIALAKPKGRVKAIYFGCFGGCLPYEKFSGLLLTPQKICEGECMVGARSIIVVDANHSIVDVATNIAKFYEFESCGKCTPCREGSMRVLNLLENISVGKAKPEDIETLQELAEIIKDTSFCGLGQTSTVHLLNALKYFRHEFEARVRK
jgi:NADH:ubiquinone oxidoreductase subunit F (NADH-binding)